MKITNKNFLRVVLGLAAFGLVFGGFGLRAADKAQPEPQKMPDIKLDAPQAPAPEEKAVPPDTVIMKVNGEAIKQAQLDEVMGMMMQQVMGQFGGMMSPGSLPPEFKERMRSEATEQLKKKVVLEQAIKQINFTPSEEEVKAELARIDSMIKAHDPADSFKAQLDKAKAQDPQIEDKLKAQITQQLQGIRVVEKECSVKVDATPEEVKAQYEKDTKKWDRVRASHILIPTQKKEGGDEAAAEKEAKTKADEALKEVKSGKDFAEVAKKFSQDPGSAENGGDLKYFYAEEMVPEFSKTAFGMKKGEISDLVKSQFGFHVIKVTDVLPSTLESAKDPIFMTLRGQNMKKYFEVAMTQLVKKAKIEDLAPKTAAAPKSEAPAPAKK